MTSMQVRGRSRRKRLPTLLGGCAARVLMVLVGALVVGILGMHAVVGTHEFAHEMSGAVNAGAGPGISLAVETIPMGDMGMATAADDDHGGGDIRDHGMGSMMMLCAAMLLTAGALLLALYAVCRVRRPWAVIPRVLVPLVREPLTRLLPTRPPPAWEFSVIRC